MWGYDGVMMMWDYDVWVMMLSDDARVDDVGVVGGVR